MCQICVTSFMNGPFCLYCHLSHISKEIKFGKSGSCSLGNSYIMFEMGFFSQYISQAFLFTLSHSVEKTISKLNYCHGTDRFLISIFFIFNLNNGQGTWMILFNNILGNEQILNENCRYILSRQKHMFLKIHFLFLFIFGTKL